MEETRANSSFDTFKGPQKQGCAPTPPTPVSRKRMPRPHLLLATWVADVTQISDDNLAKIAVRRWPRRGTGREMAREKTRSAVGKNNSGQLLGAERWRQETGARGAEMMGDREGKVRGKQDRNRVHVVDVRRQGVSPPSRSRCRLEAQSLNLFSPSCSGSLLSS